MALLNQEWTNPSPNKRNNYANPGGPLYQVHFGEIGMSSAAGELVSVRKGLQTSVAFSCINVIAQTIATLPFNVRRDTEKGKEIVKNQQYNLIHTRPNRYTSAFNFWYTVVAQMLSNGNAYALIKRNEKNVPSELVLLNSNDVKPILADGEIVYKYKDSTYIAQDSILHYYLYSFDGVCGVSPITWNAETFGYRIKQDKYKAQVMDAKPPGILSFAGELTDEQIEQNREAWKVMTSKAGTPVLSGDAKYQALQLNADQTQMIQSAELNTEEIAGIYRIPPTFIQNYRRATFSNAEQQDIVFVKHGLTPIMRVLEQETDYKLFNSRSGLYTKFNLKAILRGDTKTQAEWYRTMSNIGAMSPNEIRQLEDMSPIENGDNYFIQGAMIPLSKIDDFYSSDTEDQGERQLGFTMQQIKEGLDRLETMNKHEG